MSSHVAVTAQMLCLLLNFVPNYENGNSIKLKKLFPVTLGSIDYVLHRYLQLRWAQLTVFCNDICLP